MSSSASQKGILNDYVGSLGLPALSALNRALQVALDLG